MPKAAQFYIAIIVLAAVLLFSALPPVAAFQPTPREILSLLSFIGVGLLAEAMAIDFRLGQGRQAKSSLAFLPFLASIVLYDPRVSVLSVSLVIAVSQFVLRRNEPRRALFNVAQGTISAGLGALIYTVFVNGGPRAEIHWLGFAILTCVFFATNLVLSSVALAIMRSQPVTAVLGQVAGARGGNLLYDLLATPIALVPVGLYVQYNAAGLLVIVLPLILFRYSYLSKLQLEEANRDLLKVLVKAIETRDPYTSGHSMRVATLARMIAQDMSLPARNVDRVETAALLHDIGKIDSIYEAVIRKPHDLTSAERDLIRTHATKGADLLESLSSVNAEVVKAVRHHHERYDGTGYPSGLTGENIPVAARIIMLCDSVDAMLSDRPYRKALSVEKTRLELVRCAGTQFDPYIVQSVLRSRTLERAVALVPKSTAEDQAFGGLQAVG